MPLATFALAIALHALPDQRPPVALTFDRLVVQGHGAPAIAPEALALAGRRIRIVGHMVRMELPPRAAFYLAARPVDADESGGGTADLPLAAVRVEVPWIAGVVPRVEGPVEVVGTLEVGRAEDAEGRVSWLRVVLDPAPAAPPHPPSDRGALP